MSSLLAQMALNLVLTLVIELAAAELIFHLQSRSDRVIVALAQLVTNPIVVAGTMIAYAYVINPLPIVFVLEIAAFIAEALIYRAKGISKHPWLFSAVLNALSFVSGLLLFT